ncbi:periplasmic heavy metal sensor [Pontivivens nitratireducens]|uniref:Periplasmic heavy metal sensor n=1 Tax=Pontivivens nitratireducens TaxID=2758038 RepID=A0A6G7VLB3_9RHOB|nr:periplasmic heavy metal sensor [Pontibrevibacter nitratireducens]QIK40811.1 periplasmic heavy metal sensor [Pontibrevibacter nitratireducens]
MTAEGRKRRGITIALVISLGINLIVAGTLAGAMLRDEGHPVRLRVTPDLRAAISALPNTDRDRVRDALREAMPSERGARVERLRSQQRFASAIRAQPMDRQAIEAIFASRADDGERLRLAAVDVLLDTLEAMPQDNRIAFLERMRQSGARSPRPGDSPSSENRPADRPPRE